MNSQELQNKMTELPIGAIPVRGTEGCAFYLQCLNLDYINLPDFGKFAFRCNDERMSEAGRIYSKFRYHVEDAEEICIASMLNYITKSGIRRTEFERWDDEGLGLAIRTEFLGCQSDLYGTVKSSGESEMFNALHKLILKIEERNKRYEGM